MSLGVLFAVDDADLNALRSAEDDDAIVEYVEEVIEEREDRDWLADLDKSWELVQRALDEGRLEYGPSERIEARAILGGTLLTSGDDYAVVLVDKAEVPLVAQALADLDRAEFARRYAQIDPAEYGRLLDDEELEYAWDGFLAARTLYSKAAAAERSVIFTVAH